MIINKKGMAIEMAIGFAALMFLFSVMISLACFSAARVNNAFLYKQEEKLFVDNIYEKEVKNVINGNLGSNIYQFEYSGKKKQFNSSVTNEDSKYLLVVSDEEYKSVLECEFILVNGKAKIQKWLYIGV